MVLTAPTVPPGTSPPGQPDAARRSAFAASLRPRPRPELVTRPSGLTVEQERRRRQEKLVGALRIFAGLGYEEHLTGHVSARDPELPDHIWLNPLGRAFGRLRVSDLVLAGPDGRAVHGDGRVSTAAFELHSQLLLARPDVVSAAHTHSVHGKALAALGVPLLPITQDACMFFEDNVVVPFHGLVSSAEEGRRLVAAMGSARVAVLANHGLLTTGHSVEEAAALFVIAERAARTQLLAMAAGAVEPLAPEVARANRRQDRGDGATLFLALWEQVVEEQPDLLL
jgi:ribulose-5-phosphate 4-epimerase/fuculose-1-phosphate aldolase